MYPLPLGLAQTCFVVADLERAITQWTQVQRACPFFVGDFSGEEIYRGQRRPFALRVAVGYSGAMNIELVCPQGPPPSVFHEVLDTHGEGVHHIWNRSRDFDADVAHYLSCGFPVVCESRVPGIGRMAFVDTRPAFGVFTELQELTDDVYRALDAMHQAHLDWDGVSDPVRLYASLFAVR